MQYSRLFSYGVHERGADIGPRSGLTDEKIRAIRKDGRAQAAIARDYGINQKHVSSIKRRVVWGHVKDE